MASVLDIAGGGSFLSLFIVCDANQGPSASADQEVTTTPPHRILRVRAKQLPTLPSTPRFVAGVPPLIFACPSGLFGVPNPRCDPNILFALRATSWTTRTSVLELST